MGTDRPWYSQYGEFVWRLAHGNLGYSFQRRQSVSSIVFPAAGVTASLVAGAAVLWLAIAIVVGLVGALRPRSLIDRILTIARPDGDRRAGVLGRADALVPARLPADAGQAARRLARPAGQLAADRGLRRPARESRSSGRTT